jgi:hypothetical protein
MMRYGIVSLLTGGAISALVEGHADRWLVALIGLAATLAVFCMFLLAGILDELREIKRGR